MLSTFDAPDLSTTCTRGTSSNTPLQPLAFANDQAMSELFQALARRLLASADNDSARIERAYWICFSRPPTDFERQRFQRYLDQQLEQFTAAPQDARRVAGNTRPDRQAEAPQIAAWTAVARVLINLDGFITRE